jgi:hypothetical protein
MDLYLDVGVFKHVPRHLSHLLILFVIFLVVVIAGKSVLVLL